MAHDQATHHRPRILRATALPEPGGRARASRTTMAALARQLLETLDEPQRARVQWPFADAERYNWHFIPRERAGVAIKDMPPAAKGAVHDLLHAALSEAGYQKATEIMSLEYPLGLIENHRRHFRNSENYSVTIFGEPPRLPWGWRIEGHHLSLNFTAVTEDLFGVTPVFFGANPARVPDGYPMAGHRALGRETDLSYELIRGLDEAARERAIIARTSLGNIITEPGREDALKERQGLPLAAIDESSRNLAQELVASFARSLNPELAARELDRVRAAGGIEQFHFAWGGPLEAGYANYWRLHGPLSLIEYDNTQNDANHIHSVWHDLERDFGRDLLRQHYETGHLHADG